jgi:Resolvase, N terminal domain
MARVPLLPLLIAAIGLSVATAAASGRRRVVLAGRLKDGSGWTLSYPASGPPRSWSPRQEDLAPLRRAEPVPPPGAAVLVGYARCSTDKQDLAAQRHTLRQLGVSDDRVYLDHGMTGRNRRRPGLQQALAAVRQGDTLVVPKLDRLARSVPDARAIGDSLAVGGVRLSIGGTVYDPSDPMGKMFFNILATFAEFEVDLLRMRTREGMAIARANGKLKGTRRPEWARVAARDRGSGAAWASLRTWTRWASSPSSVPTRFPACSCDLAVDGRAADREQLSELCDRVVSREAPRAPRRNSWSTASVGGSVDSGGGRNSWVN